MPRFLAFVLFAGCLAAFGCTRVRPIITPPEFEASCRQDAAGADPACAARICDVYQAVVTDYYEDMAGCYAACKDREQTLAASVSGQCRDKVKAAHDACREFCNRKFYRCNCAK